MQSRVKNVLDFKRPKAWIMMASVIAVLVFLTACAVEKADTDNAHEMNIDAQSGGIELSLLSTSIETGILTMIFSIQDKEGDRIDESTAFHSTIKFNGSEEPFFPPFPNFRTSDFNEETGTLVYAETFDLPQNTEISEITYIMGPIRSGLVNIGGYEKTDLYNIVSNHTPSTVPERPECAEHLTPEETHLAFSDIDWSYISNIGFVDGSFHIQVKDDPVKIGIPMFHHEEKRGRVRIHLIDSAGIEYGKGGASTDTWPYYREYQLRDWDGESGDTYCEYVYVNITDVEQLKGMRLVKEGIEYTEIIDAEWSVKFTI